MRLVCTGGGTGGHIYPGLAVIEALQARTPDAEVLWVGSARGLESRILPPKGVPFEAVPAAPWSGAATWMGGAGRATALWSVTRGVLAARGILSKFRPSAVLATGGWVSVPTCLASVSLGIPTFLHESNAHPGLANRFLARWARRVFLAFPLARDPFPAGATEVVGMPLRGAVGRIEKEKARERLGIGFRERLLVVFGGSRGARRINEAMAGAIWGLADVARVVWATGTDLHEDVVTALGGPGALQRFEARGVRIVPYLDEIPWALAACDLVVTRAGAVTTAEIAASGAPAILVPYPHAAEGHQEANAKLLAERGAAVVVRDEDLTPSVLFREVECLLADPAKREEMSRRAKTLHSPGAAERILAGIAQGIGRGRAR